MFSGRIFILVLCALRCLKGEGERGLDIQSGGITTMTQTSNYARFWRLCTAFAIGCLLMLGNAGNAWAATCSISPQSPSINPGESVNWSATYTVISHKPRYRWTFQGGNPSSSRRSTPTVSYANAGTFTTSLQLGRSNDNASCTATVTVSAQDNQAPSTPQNLSANAVSSSQINLIWTASTDNIGVTSYHVYRCMGSGSCTPTTQIATTTTNSYSDTGRTANTLYRYRVRAEDSAGNLE